MTNGLEPGNLRAERSRTTGLSVFLKHFILTAALPSKEIIIIIVLLTCL